ncbi:MAG: acyl-CoA desaturase [Symploca sp. SIO1C2]|nr:acyl-CoA desaturase [Symploca sp. SIO1C2]
MTSSLISDKPSSKVTFPNGNTFRKTLNERVKKYFQENDIKPNNNPAMYLKTAIILTWIFGAWAFILFGPAIMWLKVLGCIVLGLGIGGGGMSVAHDANHGSYSTNSRINKLLGLVHDFLGVSSYLWRFRHNFLHHTYTNLDGHDVEIDGSGVIRMYPNMEHKWYHQFQHLFIWFIYPIIPFYWSINEMKLMASSQGKYLNYSIPKLKTSELITFWGMKLLNFVFFVIIPITVGYTIWQTLLGVMIAFMTYGFVVCEVFMLAHVLEATEFPEVEPESNSINDEWAIFQIKTTADFAPHNPILNWYIGGLNYQTVHHLFPHVCHIHYPKIAPILTEVCEEFGVKYNVYPTFREAIASNYRWLKLMGTASNA